MLLILVGKSDASCCDNGKMKKDAFCRIFGEIILQQFQDLTLYNLVMFHLIIEAHLRPSMSEFLLLMAQLLLSGFLELSWVGF